MPGARLVGLAAAPIVTVVLLIGFSGRTSVAEEEDWAARAKDAWHGTCQKCHAVPDATFETGRAFLAQITETS